MKLDPAQFKKALYELLREEVSCATALFESLESESSALSSMDEKLITINSANKKRLIESLQKASNARIRLMVEQGYKNSATDIKDFISSQDSNKELDILFIRLSEIAKVCFAENRLIGQLINRRTHFITQALTSLSPGTDMQSFTYEKNGAAAKNEYSQTSCSI